MIFKKIYIYIFSVETNRELVVYLSLLDPNCKTKFLFLDFMF